MKQLKISLMQAVVCCAVMFSAIGLSAQKQIFEHPDLKNIIAAHKTVAIVPFTTTISYKKQPKNFSAEANHADEIKMSTSIQSSMYTFLLRRASDYSVTFQDPERTNILLKKAGAYDRLDQMTADELAKILNVDAVIGGKFETEQTKSEGGAIASAVLFGGFGGKTGTGTLTMIINDGKTGDMIWRFFKTMDANIMSSTDDLVEHMMRKVSRNFPYMK